jgi:predicted amidophosphoribosyltransferase
MEHFKAGSSPHLAALFAAYMAIQYSQSTLPLPDIVTAVPSSRWRHWQVGQETAPDLARAFASLIDKPFLSLLKRRQLVRQELVSREERAALLPTDFRWKNKAEVKLQGKTILLIDDTITTGATLACCAEVLWEASPAKILKMACVDRGYL